MMRKLRWPLLIVLLALVAIAALLIGQQPTLLPVAPVEIQPETGGIYVEALVGRLMRLNPLLDSQNRVDQDIDRLLFSGLLRFDDHGLPQGDLADSWGISRDGTIYNFSIRANAVWHDGEPVTSDDVIFTIERMREETSLLSADLRDLWNQVDVRRLDEKTLQFRLPEPYSPFLDYLTFGILPGHLLGDLSFKELIDAQFNLSPVGSGPYRFGRLIVEDGQIAGIVLAGFEEYYLQKPFIEELAFRFYPDVRAALSAYQAGEVMGIDSVPLEVLPEVLAETNLNLHTGRLPELSMVVLNLDNPQTAFFQDINVRKALLQGINRQRIIDRLLGGQAILADGPIFPGTWAYFDETARVGFDPEAAIMLLVEAGYTIPAEGGDVRASAEGVRLEFELAYPDDEWHASLAEAIREDWARVGVNAELAPLPYEKLVNDYLNPRLYQAALIDLNLAQSPDPDPYPFWHQAQITGGQNYSKWDDRQASEYLEQARVTTDIAERTRLYRNFQVRFSQELPALPLFYPVYTYAVDADVQGVRMGPLFSSSDRFATITSWYLVARRVSGEQATETPTSPEVTP